ncbi:hypothetical protein MYX07_04690 [Patescibacteria group bacterium AH-259-L07]|nr:hypothetical protein [Patescibacteria group bacterium AH-259-L07]
MNLIYVVQGIIIHALLFWFWAFFTENIRRLSFAYFYLVIAMIVGVFAYEISSKLLPFYGVLAFIYLYRGIVLYRKAQEGLTYSEFREEIRGYLRKLWG